MTTTTYGSNGGTATPPAERSMCLLFRLGDERFAIRAADVQKVTPNALVSRLPRLPDALLGITQHRGRVVTVVDAAKALVAADRLADAGPRVDGPEQRLLILERPVRHLALLVDAVFGIESLRLPADLAQLPRGGVETLRIAQQRGRALPLVDVAAVVDFVNALDVTASEW